ncbi:putative reverse transcriptase domain-containing protein [Tanacetum coccineum]
MPIELGTFDVVIGMDWLVDQDAVIVCGKKVVHIPVKNKTLVVEGDRGTSRLKIISCIKANKYIERGHQLFVAHVTEKEPKEKRLEDVPVIRDFPEVFPDDLPGLPPPRQVEFKIELVPGAAPVARAPYRLAPSELKELADQLQELSEKGFIRPSSSPWGAPVLFVKKKDGSFRSVCIRRLDLRTGYHQLRNLRFLFNFQTSYQLTQKNKKYEWARTKRKRSNCLSRNCVMHLYWHWPERIRRLRVVYCDASLKGFGAVLMQREKVIAYASRQLRTHEENYTTHDLELGAVVFDKDLGDMILRKKCVVYRIIRAFQYILDQKELNKRLLTWIELLERLRLRDPLHDGQGKVGGDALSRKEKGTIRNSGLEWEATITMDFIVGLPRKSVVGIDSIWVIVIRLTKSATFLPVKREDSMEKLTQLYLKEIVCRHGVPISIISDRDNKFASRFWRSLQGALGTQLDMRLHPFRHTEWPSRENNTDEEDVLRALSVIDFGGSWDRHLLQLVEFSYKHILERVGPVAYKLELLRELQGIHNTFHVSNLKKCLSDESLVIPLDEIQLDDKVAFY